MLEAIEMSQEIAGRSLSWTYRDDNRVGDHIWWISDLSRFAGHYPDWRIRFDVPAILREIHQSTSDRWRTAAAG
jgi:CDP-paratose 2-epimerase